jgi:hypothetical protein
MTKEKLLLLFIVICSLVGVKAQTTIYSCNGLYCIELPAKLELQSSELNSVKRISEQGKKSQVIINTQSGHITFQQKGLNADVKSAYNKYCRVIIEYFKEDRSDPTYGRGDPIIVDRDVLYAINDAAKENCRVSGTPLMKIISTESMVINGFPVLYYSYRRMGWLKDDGKRQPPVIVNVYTIFNKYEFVKLTFSYRESERESWRDIHNNIVKSFTFLHKY